MNYVGIDYHKKYSVVTAVDEKGQVLQTTRLDNRHEPFQEFFSSLDGPSEAVLESTRTWGVMYDLLEELDGVESVTPAHGCRLPLTLMSCDITCVLSPISLPVLRPGFAAFHAMIFFTINSDRSR